MHGDELYAGSLRPPRQLRRVDGTVVPAEPHLQRHGHVDRGDGGVDQGDGMIEVAHQRRAGFAIGDVPRRASHVDVDDLGALPGSDPGALRHPMGFAAGELHHVAADPGCLQPQPRIALARGKRRTGRHLRYDETGAKPRRQPAERGVGDARHGRQDDRIGQAHAPDGDGRRRDRRGCNHIQSALPKD